MWTSKTWDEDGTVTENTGEGELTMEALEVDSLYRAAMEHDLIRQTALAEGFVPGDRFGTLMTVGFVICDALTVRGEHVPGSLGYTPSPGLPKHEDFDLNAEDFEERYPDYGELYFSWGLGLGDNVAGGWYADAIRDYLTNTWEPAHAALVAAGQDY